MRAKTHSFTYVHTGAGEIAGRYLRRFWHPVYESAQLPAGVAVPIRVMGEDFTLYRGESGRPQIVGFRCPHRGTQLSSGWVEGDQLRCFFHGWKFDRDGSCVEQPAEPKPFCRKVRIESYPTQEQLGLVFAYFGELPAPALPTWPEFETEHRVVSMAVLPCNYFQSAENIVDDVHVGFAHRSIPEIGQSPRGLGPPLVDAVETSYGLRIAYTNPHSVEHNHFIMPNMCYLNYALERPNPSKDHTRPSMRTLFWYVPIDDFSHQHVLVSTGPALIMKRMKEEFDTPHSVAGDIHAVLSGKADCHRHETASRSRRPDLIRIQDGVAIVGQGSIADRSRDHLGASDAGVVALRKIWARELRRLTRNEALTPYSRPQALPP
jgi:5,5'-dehydrodivanillate O-demethylase